MYVLKITFDNSFRIYHFVNKDIQVFVNDMYESPSGPGDIGVYVDVPLTKVRSVTHSRQGRGPRPCNSVLL